MTRKTEATITTSADHIGASTLRVESVFFLIDKAKRLPKLGGRLRQPQPQDNTFEIWKY